MKKFLKIFLALILIFSFNTSFAQNYSTITDKITKNDEIKNINLENVFEFFADFFRETTPESYKYIKLNFSWVEKWSELEKNLQILVYNNKLPNSFANFSNLTKERIKAKNFLELSKKILGTWYAETVIENLWDKYVDYYDLEIVEQNFIILKNQKEIEKSIDQNSWTMDTFNQVYDILLNDFYWKDKLDKKHLIYSAIEWLTKAAGDKHTVYFPPTESKSFKDWLAWDFEWIWTYVEMPEPGVFKITSPIIGWPADKAWIKGWDIVLAVNWQKITKENSQSEIVSWIKWQAWTEVNLTIKRWENIFDIKVKREKVHIKSIETKIDWNNFIINFSWFNEWVSNEFYQAIDELNWKSWIKKIIIDLRNNWGGYLNEVVSILDWIVPKGEATAQVDYINQEWKYISKWLNKLDLNKYELVFLQNKGTASASEIMIWTVKDYFPNTKIVWEKSYWKWSVQTIREFFDGSSIKYTIAKWFTWKTKTWIDWVWIKPDYEVELNEKRLSEYWKDNQLEKALSI